MTKTIQRLAGAALLSLTASMASAVTLEFDFRGSGGLSGSYSFMSNGVTVDVTAGSFEGGFNGSYQAVQDQGGNTVNGYITSGNTYDDTALVGQYSNGLGVTNNTRTCYGRGGNVHVCSTDNYHTVDGSGWDDFLVLSFSEDVQLTSADFSYFGYQDDFRLFYDYNGDGVLGDGDFVTYQYDQDPFFNFPTVSTNLIGFVATGSNDAWKLRGVHAELAPIPLPASGLLLLAGLGGIAAMRRRSK